MKKIALLGIFTPEAVERFSASCAGEYEVVHYSDPGDVALATGASYVVLRGTPIGPEQMDILGPDVQLYHRWGVGFDNVDVEEAGRRGIPVAITTGVNARCVAEMTMLLILAAYRRLPQLMECAKSGAAQSQKDAIAAEGRLLAGKRVGLVGVGNVGILVSQFARAFGAEVVYYDVRRLSPETEREGIAYLPFDELVATSDIVSLHLPLFESTYHMFDLKTFEKMKPTALLVNTARGGIVDSNDLAEALRSGLIWGAALDTAEEEPMDPAHPLLHSDRVVVTPHVGGSSRDLADDMIRCIMDNIRLVERGEIPPARYLANRKYFYKDS